MTERRNEVDWYPSLQVTAAGVGAAGTVDGDQIVRSQILSVDQYRQRIGFEPPQHFGIGETNHW